ncbi:MAG: D-alanine--D-alanine ligase [Anaerocolumna sp.]
MKVVVLAGGLSPERDVSLSSGSLIANSLMESGHEVLLLDVYEGLKTDAGNLNLLFSKPWEGKKYEYSVPEKEPDLAEIKKRNNGQLALIGENILEVCKLADVVFIALHGSMGENGQIQAAFDNYNIKYTGTGYIGSLLAMDKDLTKKLLVQAGIPTADWIMYSIQHNCSEVINNYNKTNKYDIIIEKTGFPCVIKPCSCGSSIGVSIVHNKGELNKSLQYAARYENNVLIEKMIKGREFSVGILSDEALPVIEIMPEEGFYNYKNKYQGGLTKEVCPADLSIDLTGKIQNRALFVHKTLRLGNYSRIDFILDENNEFICLEANTLPGMTPTSLIPQEALRKGISYHELVCMIARLPFKK